MSFFGDETMLRGMCGRYTLTSGPDRIRERFGVVEVPYELAARYNIAPSQDVPVIANLPGRRVEMFRWGLIPAWAREPSVGHRMINARAETLREKPSFRAAFAKRRCLILADGFYEWQKVGSGKVPMYVRLASREPFAFAGLWESWQPADGEAVRSCTVITTEANAVLAPIHDRMPVILAPEHYARWLDPQPVAAQQLQPLLVPYPAGEMEAFAVSRLVNNPGNDTPACIEPA